MVDRSLKRRAAAAAAATVAASVWLVGLIGPAEAAPSDLDAAFGSNGIATAAAGAPGASSSASRTAVDSAGNIVVAGTVDAASSTSAPPSDSDIVVARFTPAGQLDASFGTGGATSVHFTGFTDAAGLVIAPGGNIIVAANAFTFGTNGPTGVSSSILRFTPTGLLDASFGTAGQAKPTPAASFIDGLALDSTGNLDVAGSAAPSGSATTPSPFVERFHADGTPDATFGTSSVVSLPGQTAGQGIAVTPDGHLLVGTGGATGLGAFELTGSGALEPAFGSGGKGTVPLAAGGGTQTVLPQTDGSVVLVGSAVGGTVVGKLTKAGVVDQSFGANGVSGVDGANGAGSFGGAQVPGGAIAVEADTGGASVVFARLNPDGTPDRTFAAGGKATLFANSPFFPGGPPTIQNDGKALLGGSAFSSDVNAGTRLAVARLQGGSGPAIPAANTVTRLSGPDRIATAVAISKATFPDASTGPSPTPLPIPGNSGVVLASADNFPDALVGTPLAASLNGPLLLTHPDALDPRVKDEIVRVLGPASDGGTVTILGGTAAVGDAVEHAITGAGYAVRRIAGADRFATAVEVADRLQPAMVLEATGTNFPDGVTAGAAAAHLGGVVLLTNGSAQAAPTAAYLQKSTSPVFAVGGGAAAADPKATPVVGTDRYATAVKVATTFFVTPSAAAVATGTAFADALAGGARAATLGEPVVLSDPSTLSAPTAAYLTTYARWIDTAEVYGGTLAVSDPVLASVKQAITESGAASAAGSPPPAPALRSSRSARAAATGWWDSPTLHRRASAP